MLSQLFRVKKVKEPLIKQEQIQSVVNTIKPFSSLSVYKGKGHLIKTNCKRMDSMDKLLLGFFILNSVLIISTAIYAPTVTNSTFFSVWQFLQLCLICYLGYRSSNRKKGK